ncbi:MAG: AAA family ATPase, partial [Thermodesulfobacteriota bacterium]|nr:AAA family ATPase [Thermodesulfobacteriota bacterium]
YFNCIKHAEKTPEHTGEVVGRIKNNVLMIGPTGVGKTYMIKLIAKKIGVPFVKGDATKFSETGYVGGDVEDLVRDLVQEADGDIERAQQGIIYIDEIDKIASGNNVTGVDVSRTGVQRGLLKPMEETEVDLKVPHDIVSQMEAMEQFRRTGKKEKRTVNTRDILFIVSGAFNGLADIIRRRISDHGIGFQTEGKRKDDETDCLKRVTAEDLIHYGFESEFIGRLPVMTIFDSLTVDDLYQILKNPNGVVINSKKQDFKAYGIDIRFEDEALYRIAEKAHTYNTGARGLVSEVEKVLMKFEKKLPSTSCKRIVVTREIVENPERELALFLEHGETEDQKKRYLNALKQEKEKLQTSIAKNIKSLPELYRELLTQPRITIAVNRAVETGTELTAVLEELCGLVVDIENFERSFGEDSGIIITFDEAALNRLLEKALQGETSVDELCSKMFKGYNHGLNLIREKNGNHEFVLFREAIEDPEGYLDKLIRESYGN